MLSAITAYATAVFAQVPSSPTPTGLTCGVTTATSVSASWTLEPLASLYDLEVADASPADAQPFTSTTTVLGAATVKLGIRPGTAYVLRVRSHARAAGPTQMIDGWSNFTAAVRCSTPTVETTATATALRRVGPLAEPAVAITWTPPSGDKRHDCVVHYELLAADGGSSATSDVSDVKQLKLAVGARSATLSELATGSTYRIEVVCDGVGSEPLIVRTADPATTWLEVFRIAENFVSWPDFLANHNSGTLEGDAAFMTGTGGGTATNRTHFFDFYASPRVRYCVEIATVVLDNITRTPSGPPNVPTNTSFAEYLSCDPFGAYFANYSCKCDNKIDREIARQTPAQIESYCPNNTNVGEPCDCLPSSISASDRFTGYMPVCLPFAPGQPSNSAAEPYGGWYSHPGATKCPDDGTAVGTGGCTWRRDPYATMVYGQDLVDSGWNRSTGGNHHPTDAGIKANAAAMRRAFDKISDTCCGC